MNWFGETIYSVLLKMPVIQTQPSASVQINTD